MTQHIKIEDRTREQIAEFLPTAIEQTVISYRDHMNKEPEKNKVADHHKDAKVIISHIELLIKLARWADLPDKTVEGSQEAKILETLMAKAEAEIEAYSDDGKEQ